MRIQAKIIGLLLAMAFVFAIAFSFHNHISWTTLNLLLEEAQEQKSETFDKLVALKNKSQDVLGIDYTYWDEMVTFAENPTSEWVEQNLRSALSVYNVDAIWILNANFDYVCAIDSVDGNALKKLPFTNEEIKGFFADSPFCHFFIDTPLGLMEIRGSTIHPTADEQRKTIARGYFFSGRLWDEKLLDELATLTGGTITLMPFSDSCSKKNSIVPVEGTITLSRSLYGPDKKPLACFIASFKSQEAILLINQVKYYLILFLASALVIFCLIVFFITRWISRPLRSISKALSAEDVSYILDLQKGATEFAEVSELICKFFEQKDTLINENIERKNAEKQLKDAYEKLKNTEAQLIQTAKMATVGQLAGGVAHEINNPLTGILNNVQLIKIMIEQKREFTVGDFKQLLDVIETSAIRCKNITQSLLNFSRASKGILTSIVLNDIVEKVLVIIQHEMSLDNIVFEKDLAPDLPQILGDSQLLQQVIFDIVSNAKWAIQKKSKAQGGTIRIKTVYNPGDRTVSLLISDTGIGIPAAQLSKLFEPFFTTKAIGEGTGLGLAIVYAIINEHNGTITVESKEDEGATFRINLPRSGAAY